MGNFIVFANFQLYVAVRGVKAYLMQKKNIALLQFQFLLKKSFGERA